VSGKRPRASRAWVVVTVVSLLVACGGGGGGGTMPPGGGIGGPTPTPMPTSSATPNACQTAIPSPSASASPPGITLSSAPILTDCNTSPSGGIFLGSDCGGNAVVSCPAFARVFRHSIAFGTTYATWSQDIGAFVQQQNLASWYQEGIIPDITWMPMFGNTYAVINSGQYDAYMKKTADELKAWGYPVFLRPFHEMDGDWFPWGLYNNGADSAVDTAFIEAWQRMVNIFRQEGATNVKFIFSFENFPVPDITVAPWDNPANFYPGDAYVDWVGVTAFNRGSGTNGLQWQSFDTIFDYAYKLVLTFAPSKPIMIAELGTNEYGDGGSMKASWVSQMLGETASPSSPYPNLRMLVWFEGQFQNSVQGVFLYNSASSQPAYNSFVNGIRETTPSGGLDFRSNAGALWQITTP
jgi:hypothetical protein